MNPLSVFKTVELKTPIKGSAKDVRAILETDTLFEETPPKSWTYRGRGKMFNGYMSGNNFLLIQKPMQGTRYGAVLRGDFSETSPTTGEVEFTSWIDPRAKRKLIFGYFLSVILIARVFRDHVSGASQLPSDTTDTMMPFILCAVLPITLFATYLYEKTRKQGLQAVEALFKSHN